MLGGSFFIFLDFFCIFVVSKNQPYTPLVLDKILSFEVGCANIDYGFAFGNTQKILFIKAGAQGSMYGYRDKYLNIKGRFPGLHRMDNVSPGKTTAVNQSAPHDKHAQT